VFKGQQAPYILTRTLCKLQSVINNVSEPRKEILLAFSLYTNGKKLLDTKHAADTLSSLHGIRYLSICWIVLVHKYTLLNDVPSINHFTQLSVSSFWQVHSELNCA